MRDLVKNIFENITRQNQLSETAATNKDFSNKWKQVPMGKSVTQEQKHTSKNLFISNSFELLSQDDDCERVTVNNDDRNQNIIITLTDLSKSSKKRPNPVINQHSERESSFVTRSTENINRNKIKIICDSIPKGIRLREFNRNINNGNAKIKCFPGSTVKQLKHYSIPMLSEERPNTVVLHVGINDLVSTRENKTPDDELAIEIMNSGWCCVEYGVETVFISGLTFCSRAEWERIEQVNCMMEIEAQKNGFIFITNDAIKETHLWRDGIHLQESGKIILANNFIYYINKKNSSRDSRFFYIKHKCRL